MSTEPIFSITRTRTDQPGNAGLTETHGNRPTLAQAQAHGETLVQAKIRLWWKEFSATTWGLMDGGTYTHVLVSDLGAQRAAARPVTAVTRTEGDR